MNSILFAFDSGLTERVAAYAIKCLAVAGAFLLGYWLGKAVVWAIDHWLLATKTPESVKRLCKILCGVIAAIIVAMIVFGEGGSGLFGGGGTGVGKQSAGADSGTPRERKKEEPSPTPHVPQVLPPKTQPELKPIGTIVPVTVYGGSIVQNDRYYQIGDDPSLKTFKELQAILLARKSQEQGNLALSIRLPADKNMTSGDPRIIDKVSDWAKNEGIVVIFPPEK